MCTLPPLSPFLPFFPLHRLPDVSTSNFHFILAFTPTEIRCDLTPTMLHSIHQTTPTQDTREQPAFVTLNERNAGLSQRQPRNRSSRDDRKAKSSPSDAAISLVEVYKPFPPLPHYPPQPPLSTGPELIPHETGPTVARWFGETYESITCYEADGKPVLHTDAERLHCWKRFVRTQRLYGQWIHGRHHQKAWSTWRRSCPPCRLDAPSRPAPRRHPPPPLSLLSQRQRTKRCQRKTLPSSPPQRRSFIAG